MSYLALCAAPFDNNDNQPNTMNEKKKNKTKTLKKVIKESRTKPNEEKISNIHDQCETDVKTEDSYEPQGMIHPANTNVKLTNVSPITTNSQSISSTSVYPQTETSDGPVTTENFTTIEGSEANNYFKQQVPYYTDMSNQPIQRKDELLNKLDKILHLLEEQKDEQSGHVTEELVLYSFLGIFIIFISDSFARAGKYMR